MFYMCLLSLTYRYLASRSFILFANDIEEKVADIRKRKEQKKDKAKERKNYGIVRFLKRDDVLQVTLLNVGKFSD